MKYTTIPPVFFTLKRKKSPKHLLIRKKSTTFADRKEKL